MSLANLQISQKLPILIVTMCILTALITGIITINKAQSDLHHATEDKLMALQASRENALENYLDSIKQDLSSLSTSPYVHEALVEFMNGWNELGFHGKQEKILQKLYITDNPHPTGSKEELDYANDGSLYSKVHAEYHPWFRHFLHQRDYYDIFLFAPNGDLVYTVFKEPDYATNLNTGKWKDSDLGNAFRAARDNPEPDQQFFFDFKSYEPSNGAAASFISQPILNKDGSLAGVLAFQMPIARINNVMQVSAGMGRSGETYIVGSDHLMRSDSRFSEDESTILKTEVPGETVDLAIQGEKGFKIVKDYRGIEVLSAYGPLDFLGTRWAILAEMDESEVMEPINEMKKFAIFATLGAVAVMALIAIYASGTISKPITNISSTMGTLAQGRFDIDIPGVERHDEIGQMAASVQVFKENGIKAQKLQEEQALAEQRAVEEKKRLMHELAESFDSQVGGMVSSLASASTELHSSAQAMRGIADNTSHSSQTVAASSEEASTNVSTVASAMEEMSASVSEIASQVTNVKTKSNDTANNAQSANETVGHLNQLAENIGEVVVAIQDIAEQTNLLALNATIEAARAGEAGKGFAVVADEVKKLATQTNQKTEEISSRIDKIQSATRQAVDAMESIINNVAGIDESVTGVSAAVEEQNATTDEIVRSISEASQGVQEVSRTILEVQKGAGEAGTSADAVLQAAQEVSELSENLKASVDQFLKQIRSDNT